jgi:valyl-tRNA synthetase
MPLLERYIISRCHEVSLAVTAHLEEFKFAEASKDIHDFIWNEFADWFIEV